MRAALILNGLVTGAVELADNWDQPDAGGNAWSPPEGHIVVPSAEAGAGWTWNGSAFTRPPANPDPPPPDLVEIMDVALLKIAFNHENRIRALEGKPAITLAQFKTALRTLLA